MAIFKVLQRISGKTQGIDTVEVSTGAADANKVPNTNAAGVLGPTLLNASQVGGVGAASKIAQLDANGQFPLSMMPTGVAADVKAMPASETIAGGDYVNLWLDTGVLKARKADSTNGRPADGYAPVGVASGATVTVYLDGINNARSGLTLAADYWLGTTGGVTTTPPSTGVSQYLGKALSATELPFRWAEPVYL